MLKTNGEKDEDLFTFFCIGVNVADLVLIPKIAFRVDDLLEIFVGEIEVLLREDFKGNFEDDFSVGTRIFFKLEVGALVGVETLVDAGGIFVGVGGLGVLVGTGVSVGSCVGVG